MERIKRKVNEHLDDLWIFLPWLAMQLSYGIPGGLLDSWAENYAQKCISKHMLRTYIKRLGG